MEQTPSTTDLPAQMITQNMTTIIPRHKGETVEKVATKRTDNEYKEPTGPPDANGKGLIDENKDPNPEKVSGSTKLNIPLIVGIVAGIICILLLIAFAFYRYKNRDEGSYKVDESKNYGYQDSKPPPQVNGGIKPGLPPAKPSGKKKDVKEWYV